MGDIINNATQITLPGNLVSGFSFEQIGANIGAYLHGLIAKIIAMIPEQIMAIYNQHTVLFVLALACILGIIAFEGYRFFRVLVHGGSAFLFGLIGYWYIAPMSILETNVKPLVPEYINYYAVVAVACAALALLLCRIAFNFVLFGLGAAAGYILGSTVIYGFLVSYFNSLTFLQMDSVKKVVGGIMAFILALVFVLMFKVIFLFITSFAGSIGAAMLLQSVLIPGADDTIKIVFAAIGFAFAIWAMVRQRKEQQNLIFAL